MEPARILLALRESASIAGSVATHCDRSSHNETSSGTSLAVAGVRLRELAGFLARELDVDLLDAYRRRLEAIERRSAYEPLLPKPPDLLQHARTWRDVQVVQLKHDRHYYPDIVGAAKADQVVHVSLHLSKITAALADLIDENPGDLADFSRRRLPDLLLFGLKLSTLAGETLDGPLTEVGPLVGVGTIPPHGR